MYCQRQIPIIFSCLLVNKFVYKQIKSGVHTSTWIPIMVQSFNFIPLTVFEELSLNWNNNNDNNDNDNNDNDNDNDNNEKKNFEK